MFRYITSQECNESSKDIKSQENPESSEIASWVLRDGAMHLAEPITLNKYPKIQKFQQP